MDKDRLWKVKFGWPSSVVNRNPFGAQGYFLVRIQTIFSGFERKTFPSTGYRVNWGWSSCKKFIVLPLLLGFGSYWVRSSGVLPQSITCSDRKVWDTDRSVHDEA